MKSDSALHPGRLAAFIGITIASVAMWQSPWLLPLKLLAVMGHETGHALASLVVGGRVDKVTIAADESGACLSAIPETFVSKVVVYSAGYVGSSLIAVLLLLLTFRLNARRPVLWCAAVWLVGLAALYARDFFTLGFCLAFAVVAAAAARWLPDAGVSAVNLLLATFTALYAAIDLRDDLWSSTVRAHSDAQLLANVTGLPAVIWAAVWSLLSVAILGAGAWLALSTRSPRR